MDQRNQVNKATYPGIDLFKFIAAILIVWLHATETVNPIASGIQFTLTRFCVPFFFICSGFFFYSGLTNAEDPKAFFWKREKRLVKLFLIYGVVISGPIAAWQYFVNNPDASIFYILLLVIRRVFVIGYGAYWYLLALIATNAVFYACWRMKWEGLLVFAMIAGQILQLGYSSFRGIGETVWVIKNINQLFYLLFSADTNFIMTGIPLFGIGWLLCKCKAVVPKGIAWAGWLVFTGLRVWEYSIPRVAGPFWAENGFTVLYIPQAVMFFFMAYHSKGLPKYGRTLRRLSTFIYLAHWIVLYSILDPVMLAIGIDVYDPWLIPAKVVLTLLVCLAVFWPIAKSRGKSFLVGG